MPKRARSKSAAPTDIISMAQQARPNVAGHMEYVLAHLTRSSSRPVRKLCWRSSRPMSADSVALRRSTGSGGSRQRLPPDPVERRRATESALMGLEDLQHNFLTGRLEDLVKWARTYSMWPATFGLACCAIEMMSVGAADFDLARFGMEVFRSSPRQADLMIVAGRVSQKMAPVLRQVYDQMMEPKWVLSMGVCASSGGMFNNYAIVQGVDQIVPVDVYAPGCPPTPETLMHAILTLHEKVRTNDITHRAPVELRGATEGPGGTALGHDEGVDTDDAREHGDESTSGWTPDRPDAVHLGTPRRNPVIARSVGEPL